MLAASLAAVIGLASLTWALFDNWNSSGSLLPQLSGSWLEDDSAVVAPAAAAFGIWPVLFAALAGYLVWQWLPRNRGQLLHIRLRPWALCSVLLGILWLQLLQWNHPGLSLAFLLGLALVLVVLVRIISGNTLFAAMDRWFTRATFGVYCGWVMICTIVNLAIWLRSIGFEPLVNVMGTLGALLVLLTGLAVGALTFRNPMGIYVNVGSLWAVTWIAVARFTGPLYSTAMALCASIAAALMLICLLAGLRRRLPAVLRGLFDGDRDPEGGLGH